MTQKPKKVMPRSPVAADQDLGVLIRKRRLDMNVTQEQLGNILGVSFQQIQKYEKGVNRVNANRLSEIATALKMRPDEFYSAENVLPDVSSLIDIDSKVTLRMIRAFTRIKDQATQRQMVVLVETMAAAIDK